MTYISSWNKTVPLRWRSSLRVMISNRNHHRARDSLPTAEDVSTMLEQTGFLISPTIGCPNPFWSYKRKSPYTALARTSFAGFIGTTKKNENFFQNFFSSEINSERVCGAQGAWKSILGFCEVLFEALFGGWRNAQCTIIPIWFLEEKKWKEKKRLNSWPFSGARI